MFKGNWRLITGVVIVSSIITYIVTISGVVSIV